MAYPLFLTVRPVPAPEDIPALRELLEKSFPHADNIPYLDALSASPLPRVTAQRLGALSLLPSLLAEAGIVPEDLILRRDSHGRPYCEAADGSLPFCELVGAPAPFDFNLSHTDAHVAAALLVGGERVGIDIEEPIPPARALPLIRRYCTEGELSLLENPADDLRAAEFFTATWVKREAMAKQEGRGMPLRYDTANPPSEILLWSGFLLGGNTPIAVCAPREDAPLFPSILPDSLPVQFL